MAKPKIKCTNCGRETTSVRAAGADGWLVDAYETTGEIFCCCVCKSEYSRKKVSKRKK